MDQVRKEVLIIVWLKDNAIAKVCQSLFYIEDDTNYELDYVLADCL